MDLQKLSSLNELNKKQFSNDKEYYDFLMFEIQSHLVEIDDLKNKKDPHLVKEIADIALLCEMLALHEGASEEDFSERTKKIEEKIKEGKK